MNLDSMTANEAIALERCLSQLTLPTMYALGLVPLAIAHGVNPAAPGTDRKAAAR